MAPFLDARLPLIFGLASEAGAADALLLEGAGKPARGRDWFTPDTGIGHPQGCTCCEARNGAGMALARLVLARGRGSGLFFNRVIAVIQTEAGRRAVRDALDCDPIASGFFKEHAKSEC